MEGLTRDPVHFVCMMIERGSGARKEASEGRRRLGSMSGVYHEPTDTQGKFFTRIEVIQQ